MRKQRKPHTCMTRLEHSWLYKVEESKVLLKFGAISRHKDEYYSSSLLVQRAPLVFRSVDGCLRLYYIEGKFKWE